MDAATLVSAGAPQIPTQHIAVDLASTDHQFDVAANSKATQAPFARRIYVGVGGDVAVRWAGDTVDVVYKSVPAGTFLIGTFVKVIRTTTTATNLIAEQ